VRIGFVICGNLDMGSGGFLYDRKLVEYLRMRGDEVEVVALPWYGYARSLTLNISRVVPKRLRHLAPDIVILFLSRTVPSAGRSRFRSFHWYIISAARRHAPGGSITGTPGWNSFTFVP
jgi:hypothetical protein